MDNDIKIGILIPKSQQYPALDKDFVRGLKLNNLKVKFLVESIGIGADEKVIIEKIQKLNFQEDVSIIIGFFGHNNVSEVYQYASNNDIILLTADLGATLPYETVTPKGVYINSFGLTESCYHLGNYLTEKNIKKLLLRLLSMILAMECCQQLNMLLKKKIIFRDIILLLLYQEKMKLYTWIRLLIIKNLMPFLHFIAVYMPKKMLVL